MDYLPREAIGDPLTGKPVRRHFLRAALFLTRPIVMGLLALLSILGACQTYGSTVSPSYRAPAYAETPVGAPASETSAQDDSGASESDAVPLLFLSFVGLAGMALSRTGSSKERRDEGVSPGQKISR